MLSPIAENLLVSHSLSCWYVQSTRSDYSFFLLGWCSLREEVKKKLNPSQDPIIFLLNSLSAPVCTRQQRTSCTKSAEQILFFPWTRKLLRRKVTILLSYLIKAPKVNLLIFLFRGPTLWLHRLIGHIALHWEKVQMWLVSSDSTVVENSTFF